MKTKLNASARLLADAALSFESRLRAAQALSKKLKSIRCDHTLNKTDGSIGIRTFDEVTPVLTMMSKLGYRTVYPTKSNPDRHFMNSRDGYISIKQPRMGGPVIEILGPNAF